MCHTLTLDAPIELRAAFYPHLSFWMRGQTSTADLVSVDISSDGGQSWTLVDLDLTPFVGQVVALRFHLDATQPLPEGGAGVGLWLDDVTVQEVPPYLWWNPFRCRLENYRPSNGNVTAPENQGRFFLDVFDQIHSYGPAHSFGFEVSDTDRV